MENIKIPVKLSLNWSRRIIYEQARVNGLNDKSYCNALSDFYSSLINHGGYTATTIRGKAVCIPKGVFYGDRISQRRRSYEIIELVRDYLYGREISVDELFYSYSH